MPLFSRFKRQQYAEELLIETDKGLKRLASIPKLKLLLKIFSDDYVYRILHEVDLVASNLSPEDSMFFSIN